MPQHNEYFCNAEEGQNKVARWVGYIFPVPLSTKVVFSYNYLVIIELN